MWTTLIMLAAGAGAIAGLIKMKQGEDWGKGVVIACAILAILLAAYNTNKRMNGGKISQKDIARRQANNAAYQEVSGEKLGLELARKFPGAKAVVIRPTEITDIDPAIPALGYGEEAARRLAGLKRGFSDVIEILTVVHPPVTDDMRANMEYVKQNYKDQTGGEDVPPEDYLMSLGNYGVLDVDEFNAATSAIPSDATMVVVLSDFPYELEKLDLWKKKLTVAGIITAIPPKMPAAIEAGYISALVITSPKADYLSLDLPENMEERFNRRFLFITPENLKAVAEANEKLFPKAK
ncbi:MAG: hypothetical protein RRC34_03265 [Lentisphaeria bacterium]|nr:hypothetical protein [Lentisphaeria bacterium]